MLECAIYDELRGEHGVASVQLDSIRGGAVNCQKKNSKKVPNFWKEFSMSLLLLESMELRVL